ncbi:hypothetical protein TRM7557_02037 [Tritonibacter multivorans]|uniref:Uncharacterized protein n=1 Tax=Tritonibacter multivorans TaxID=928856 RepID=A0A0P1GBA5_9RHOB|nr:hypothetical protein [Tritonibacter multivorans]MDA7421964.1 hypothetical protein [Tritonibacter multivorans]CUH78768.1 hypothetical protein TRM7557_02037 [Tritonibacter multivorans]SFD68698.1 hypothetical protein SAMN04488049_12131 [Tritonibacter multivorans]
MGGHRGVACPAGGNDALWGFTGDDTLDGGTGEGGLRGEDGSDQFILADGFGSDTIFGLEAMDYAEDIDFRGVSTINSFAALTPA